VSYSPRVKPVSEVPAGPRLDAVRRSVLPVPVPSRGALADSTGDVLALQRAVGNRAVSQLLGRQVEVAPEDHPLERQAEMAERSPWHREGDPSGVRVHVGGRVDEVARMLGAEGFSYRRDVFLSSQHYRSGTESGERLRAHELAHATGPAATSGLVHLKRVRKRLDFLRVKKIESHIARGLMASGLRRVGAGGLASKVDTPEGWGHWWVEAGVLPNTMHIMDWRPAESYGWWPEKSGVTPGEALTRVKGSLNRGDPTFDPHHGDAADVQYHPALEVEESEPYEQVRDRVMDQLYAFANGFDGSWNWRLGWGKNCHTFIERMEKQLGLSRGGAVEWLEGMGVRESKRPAKAAAAPAADSGSTAAAAPAADSGPTAASAPAADSGPTAASAPPTAAAWTRARPSGPRSSSVGALV
jgi:hypothetical protein